MAYLYFALLRLYCMQLIELALHCLRLLELKRSFNTSEIVMKAFDGHLQNVTRY